MMRQFDLYRRFAASEGIPAERLMLQITNLWIDWNGNKGLVEVHAQVKNVSDFSAVINKLQAKAIASFKDNAYNEVEFDDLSFLQFSSDMSPGSIETINASSAFNPPMGTQGNLSIMIYPRGFVPTGDSMLTAKNTWINVGIGG